MVLKENIYKTKSYEVSFTFFISLGENKSEYQQSIIIKDKALDLLDKITEIDNYDVYKDDEDWCINCIAEVKADTIKNVDKELNRLLRPINLPWDYHYIKGIDTKEFWQP